MNDSKTICQIIILNSSTINTFIPNKISFGHISTRNFPSELEEVNLINPNKSVDHPAATSEIAPKRLQPMRWCCGSSAQSTSSSVASSVSSQLDEAAEEKTQKNSTTKAALANGGKRRRKGTKLPLKTFNSQIGGSSEKRPQPEGILKGTHQRGHPPGRTVQYAEGTHQSGDVENEEGELMDENAAEQRPMLAQQDSSPTCSSPSPSPGSSGPSSPRTSPMDQYGPMLLRPCKRALLVLHSAPSFSSSSSMAFLQPPDCPFIACLRHAGWQVQACIPQSALEIMRCRRPVIVLVDGRIAGANGSGSGKEKQQLTQLLGSLRDEVNHHQTLSNSRQPQQPAMNLDDTQRRQSTIPMFGVDGGEDVLFGWLLDKMPNERRMRQMSKLRVQQFFLRSSTDISLCEQFSRLSSRLRAVPALFAVVEEAQQPIKICDDRNIVQYVNKAYELLTGKSRTAVLGSDGAAEIAAQRNHHQKESRAPNHVATAAIAASTTAAVTAAISWSTTTTGVGDNNSSSPPSSSSMPPPPPQSNQTATTAIPPGPPLITTTPPPVAKSEGNVGREEMLLKKGGRERSEHLRLSIEVGQSGAEGGGGAERQTDRPPPPPSPNPSNRRRSSDWQCIAVPTTSNSHQYVYVKRGSADAAFFRADRGEKGRSSGALVDAPITEALSALGNILHRCDDETQIQLREAMRILSSSELYTPNITRFRENDRIASGYYDGLIRLHHPNRQRKRSVVDAFRDHQQRRVSASSNISGIAGEGVIHHFGGDKRDSSAGNRRRVSTEIMNILEREQFWDFDVIELERVTDHHPLSSLGQKIFERWNVCEALHCPSEVLHKWFTVIEANYQSGNAYHNATHAADVLQATSYFLNSDPVGELIQDQHAPAALIAATVHDLDHPGRGNAFLMNTRQRLALLYNDHSILENHHVALAFQLTLSQNGVNIFAQMPREEFVQMRQAVIDMVLATDMSRHFEHLAKFQQLMALLPDADEDRDTNSLIICRMMVKCADIANPTREWKLCHQWAMRIVEEYFDQTAEEIQRKLPVTMKGFDRETCNLPLTQCTFADMFARETFTLWCEFADLPHLLTHLEENYARWKEQSTEWNPKKNNTNLLSRSRIDNLR